MICYKCQVENEPGAHYCKQCGADLWASPEQKDDGSRRSLMHVLIILGWEYFTYLAWIIVQRLVVMRGSYRSGFMSFTKLFSAMRWVFGGIEMVLLVVFAVLARNNIARICLIVFAVLRLLLLVYYQFS